MAREDAFVDRVAERDVGKVMRIRITTSEIAHAGEAGLDRRLRIGNHLECELRNVFVEHAQAQLVVVPGIVEGQVGMRVHETGREGRVAEVDDLRVIGNGDVASRRRDNIAFHHDDAVRQKSLRFAVEEAGRFEGDDGWRCVGRE